jgi:hypothetical protein
VPINDQRAADELADVKTENQVAQIQLQVSKFHISTYEFKKMLAELLKFTIIHLASADVCTFIKDYQCVIFSAGETSKRSGNTERKRKSPKPLHLLAKRSSRF